MSVLRRLLPLLAGVLLMQGAHAADVAELRLPAPGTADWQPLTFPKIDQHTSYEALAVDGREAVRSQSRCSASALIAPVKGLDLAEMPELVWSWKIDRPLAAEGSERDKPGDDFAARVYVAFRFDPEGSSTWERVKRSAAEAVYGAELPGNTLNYVWARTEAAGAAWKNPFTERAQMLSRGQGELRQWREERVDVLADYRKSFGGEPTQVLFVGIMTDSDNGCGAAGASFADFRFAPARNR